MSDKIGFFEENKDELSMMRLLCFIALLTSIAFGVLTILYATPATVTYGVLLTIVFLIGAMAPKAIQKFAETKLESILNKK